MFISDLSSLHFISAVAFCSPSNLFIIANKLVARFYWGIMLKYSFFLIAVLFLSSVVWSTESDSFQPEIGYALNQNSEEFAKKFMVATANPIATKVGYDVLDRGGNAIDAAIAIQMTLNVVEPQSSGIGGGAFALYWDAKKRQLSSFDGRETAPLGVSEDYFVNDDGTPKKFWDSVPGGASVGVPGTLALMEFMHKGYGSLPWEELFQPAMRLAKNGFPVSPRLAAAIDTVRAGNFSLFKDTVSLFIKSDGTPMAAGNILKNKELYATFKQISKEGASAFYGGRIAESIISSIKNSPINPGVMKLVDLKKYRVKVRTPTCIKYRVYDVCGMGPPSSGGLAVGQILGILNNSNLSELGRGVKSAHLFIEASKLAYADRNLYVADEDFIPVPKVGLLKNNYLRERFKLINSAPIKKARPGRPSGSAGLLRALHNQEERGGTTHFVIFDRQ